VFVQSTVRYAVQHCLNRRSVLLLIALSHADTTKQRHTLRVIVAVVAATASHVCTASAGCAITAMLSYTTLAIL
jgi:hypothetical protein